nr:cytosine permease [Frondihabitans sp. PhB188]
MKEATPDASPRGVEANGVNAIDESERKGTPRQLFWPWFAANISVLGIGYGAYLLNFAVSFWQAIVVGVLGIAISFLFCGLIALAGKRGNAPTMTLGRAPFGVRGNRVPSVISWVLTVGWETALTSLAVLATETIFTELGFAAGVPTKIVALVVIAALVVVAGILGFDFIMRLQKWITLATAVLTVVFVILTLQRVDFAAVAALPSGPLPSVIGGFVFMMTGFGLGWVNAAADYSRYLPRSSSSAGVVWWTTFGAALAPIILFVFGLFLAGSSTDLLGAINDNPIGALVTVVPKWFLVPFAVVAVLGLVGGSVMNIYSSGFSFLNMGVTIPRYAAATVDGVVMIAGTIYVAFFATSFIGPFQGFLITLGVPIAAWAGIFLADIQLRRTDYSTADLFDAKGRYGSVQWPTIALIVVGTMIGWGLVDNSFYAGWLGWQGYLLGPEKGAFRTDWSGANLGVLAALAIGYVGTLLFTRRTVRRQENLA